MSSRKASRPLKITELITVKDADDVEHEFPRSEVILRALRIGVPQKWAAQTSGVDESTLTRWLAQGREWDGTELDEVPEASRVYAAFARDVMRAKGAAVAFHVGVLTKAAQGGSWRASLEWLRTQAPEDFRQKIGFDFDGDRKPAPLNPETQEELRAAFASAFAGELADFDPAELTPIDAGEES